MAWRQICAFRNLAVYKYFGVDWAVVWRIARASLTAAESEAVRRAGHLYEYIDEHVIAQGSTRNDDLAELRAAVHVIQRMVLAQAAARAYRHQFRLLGEPD